MPCAVPEDFGMFFFGVANAGARVSGLPDTQHLLSRTSTDYWDDYIQSEMFLPLHIFKLDFCILELR